MAIDVRKHESPVEGEQPRWEAIRELSLSTRDPIPVANATERAQLATALAAAGITVSTSNPLYIYRSDLGVEEVSTNGSTWRRTRDYARQSDVYTFEQNTSTSDVYEANITFTTGLFTLPPVFLHALDGPRQIRSVITTTYNRSSAGVTLVLAQASGANFNPAGFKIHWTAIQATLGSAVG